MGGEFIVNNDTAGYQFYPSIDVRYDGALVVAWLYSPNVIDQKIITSFDGELSAKHLIGGDGNDSFIGSPLADTLDGGGGNDRLEGLAGNDSLTGGEGNDRFVFNAGFGHDTVTHFQAGPGPGDVMQFSTAVFANFTAVMTDAVDDGTNTTITFDANNSITLNDVVKTDLVADDFAFI